MYIPEERVGQHHIIQVSTCRVVEDISINKEEKRHINLLSGKEFLFFEAEALDFSEVRRNLRNRLSKFT